MRTSCRVTVFSGLLLLACSCAETHLYRSSVYGKAAIFPEGDAVGIMLVDYAMLGGELLFASDDGIYLLPFVEKELSSQPGMPASWKKVRTYGELVVISLQDVRSIVVRGYANTEWKKGIVVFEVAPAVLLGLVGAIHGENPESFFLIVGALSLPTMLNAGFLAAGTPPAPRLTYPVTEEDLPFLNMHARFPQGLTLAQLQLFLISIKNYGR